MDALSVDFVDAEIKATEDNKSLVVDEDTIETEKMLDELLKATNQASQEPNGNWTDTLGELFPDLM